MKNKRRLKSIEIRRAVNGVTVRHETEPVKRSSGAKSGTPYVSDYEPAQEHAFNDHGAAHAHMTKHLAQLFSDEASEDPDEEAAETPAQEKAEQPADRKSDVAAFHRLRKGGHLG